MFFFSDDYIKFIYNIKYYLSEPIQFINITQSKHKEQLLKNGGKSATCPIGLLGDVEIIFLHYSSKEAARIKWEKRKRRVNYENLIFKFSEMNGCTKDYLARFDKLEASKKVAFVTRDYGLSSQCIFREYKNAPEILNDTLIFRRYFNLRTFIYSGVIKEKWNNGI